MGSHCLRFDSRKKTIGLTAPSNSHEESVGDWLVSESLSPHPQDDLRNKGLGLYQLTLEQGISTQQQIWPALRDACDLAREIDAAWCYAWGQPFNAAQIHLDKLEAPSDWTGNLQDVDRSIQRESNGFVVGDVQIVSSHWFWYPCFPLKVMLNVRNAIFSAPAVVKELIQLHVRSFQDSGAQLYLLAKSLEIVGAFFAPAAGKRRSRPARNAGIENAMKTFGVYSSQARTIDWLFNIANERFDVRHAWDAGSPGVALHPRMTHEERNDFISDANLVVRAFVCDRLAIDIPQLETGDPPKTGRWDGETLQFPE